ncbi:hypothetical protein B0H10DRAFT_2037383 [Mycena sp. CBHHK59/15]|nr:hypothetical protein B0H10DRAFT_2037383 [Mycena sp. CBHHK59/15]
MDGMVPLQQVGPPRSNWGNSTQLAREKIEEHVRAHMHYSSMRGNLDRVPHLVDLAAERLADMDETLDDIPPVMLTLRDPDFENAESTFEGSTKNIDEWILLNEKWLRDSGQTDWQRGLVTLNDADFVFRNSILTESGRTITRPDRLPGYEVLCEAREREITIQPSLEAFTRAFERMSDGLLKNLDWNNVMVAGAWPWPDPAERWKSSDVDVYIYGLPPKAANEKVKHIFDTFRNNLPAGTSTLAVRNCSTITFYARYPLRRIQIVLKLVESPRAVLLNFDLDICAMGWDGSELWMLPRAARALETGYNVFTMDLVLGHYLCARRESELKRVFKYADKVAATVWLSDCFAHHASRATDSASFRPMFRHLRALQLKTVL